MNSKHLIWLCAIVLGYLGGFVPTLFGAGSISMAAVVGNMIGGLLGVYVGFKLSQMF